MRIIRKIGCDFTTLGQYLESSKDHVPMVRYVPPEELDQWAATARDLGFREVSAGPLVRSSYRAYEFYQFTGAVKGMLTTILSLFFLVLYTQNDGILNLTIIKLLLV